MKKAILATKVGMTQIFNEDGMLIPVTVLQAGPCVVTQVKTEENDGYTSVQVGFGEIREKLVNKPEKGHFDKAGVAVKRFVKEFRFDNAGEYEVGQEIKADIFAAGDHIDATAVSKGKGFQGAIKRHGQSRGPMAHGSKYHRHAGSNGACSDPSKVSMGQKVNPHGLRVGVIKDWDSRWYAEDKFADYLVEDYNIRTFLKKKLYSAGVSKIEIERASDRVKIIIYTAKPGIVIGKGGAEIEKVKAELQKYTDKKLIVDIKEVKRPDKDAQLVAENIALQLENRISFRRAMKSTMQRTMKAGAKGIKTSVSGRLGGADMARTEFYSEGTIPLQTLRADIDYGFAEADTTYGKVGVKAWIYNGEILPTKGTKEGSDK